MTTTKPHAALAHTCPFCGAEPGRPCRTHRGRGAATYPHIRRVAIVDDWIRRNHERRREINQALCCECGNLRTFSANHHFALADENAPHSAGHFSDPRGWRRTGTLKCSECGRRTRHAVLREADARFRDYDEQIQAYVLGADWPDEYTPDRERLRGEYFAQFPRNPYAHHWYVISEAQAAWDAGERTVTALCGETMTLSRDPKTARSRDVPMSQLVEPDEPREVDYEDPETGLWWEDMTCVNCLRVTNERRLRYRRETLEALLAWFARHPETIPNADVDALLAVLEPLAETQRQQQS
ncbi:hypothetical protein ACNUDN_11745 [Mycobacterium sp. smrl_JER01]|uniref:zinc finger domain-containing protein n=1 Tax=Mycobacterium sp. smrl_JER01 TaxID=3402633 RepID=UPI003AC140D8